MESKKCNHCQENKPVSDFTKSTGQCKSCRYKTNRAYYQKRNGVLNRATSRKYIVQEKKYKEKGDDNYTNHFLSHFGFFDVAPDPDRASKNGNVVSYYISNGVQLTESQGLR